MRSVEREISEAKLRDYLLNERHEIGAAKARFFIRLGFARDGSALRRSLLEHAVKNPVETSIATLYGTKTIVRCRFSTPDGSDPCIVTVWMQEDEGPFRLVTAYPS